MGRIQLPLRAYTLLQLQEILFPLVTHFPIHLPSKLPKLSHFTDILSSKFTSSHLLLQAPTSTLPSAPTEEPVIELVDYATALLDTALTLVKHRTLSLFKFGYTLSILTHGMLTDVTLIFLCVTKPEVVSL